jgi:hypothetical protein
MIEFGTPKWKMLSWMKSTACLELMAHLVNLSTAMSKSTRFALAHLVNLSTMMSRWVKPLGCLSEWPQKIQTPYRKWPSDGDRLEFLGQGMDLPGEVLSPPARSYYLCCIAGHGRPAKSLLESLFNHAP